MRRNPETAALLEQALRHVLSEQDKTLKRADAHQLNDIFQGLNQIAIETSSVIAEGFSPSISTSHLTKAATKLEALIDDRSEALWTPILVSVSAVYERIEKSLKREPGKRGLVSDVRAHYHNLRIRLLEQMIGARMLVLPSDRGDEKERIWQQFLQRQLGPQFRVLRGGHICDHEGNSPPRQVDLIVVPADAHVFVPGDSEDGKVQVLIDQVISAIEVTSNLTVKKLKEDWRKLQDLPLFAECESEFPNLKGHPWPLCFIVAAHSDPFEKLEKAWDELCREGLTRIIPQFVITLDGGYLYSGPRRWPAPRFPGNYVAAEDVNTETDIYAGLGLAWLIAQHQGRLAVIKRQSLGPVTRFAKLLDEGMLRELPATYSPRFETMFQMRDIAGAFGWGSVACFAHNRLQLRSLIRKQEVEFPYQAELFQTGVDAKSVDWQGHADLLRWFRYASTRVAGDLLAIEEWIAPKSKTEHHRRVAVFDTVSGEELTGAEVDALTDVSKIDDFKRK